MDLAQLPQAEFKTLTDSLLDCLGRGAGEHRRARFHVDVEGADQPELPNMTREGRLISTDPEAKGKPFASGNVSKPSYALLKAATKAGCPLYLVQYDFAKEGQDWKYSVKVQALGEYREICVERRPLEEAVVPLLLSAVEPEMPDWRQIHWDLDLRPKPNESLELFATVKELQFRKFAMTEELKTKADEFRAFYKAKGFDLQLLDVRLLGGPKKKVREVEVFYV